MIERRWTGIIVLILIAILITQCTGNPPVESSPASSLTPTVDVHTTIAPTRFPSQTASAQSTEVIQSENSSPEILSYQVINSYPHDSGAFTEGLVIYNGELYETTGLNGKSSIRQVDLVTGRVERMRRLGDEYFGEGLAIIDNKMVWATWKSNIGFVYDLDSFEIIDQFEYQHEGWGLAYDGSNLFLSDGTDVIHILSTVDYSEIGLLQVTDQGQPVTMINELEFIEGELFANIWLTTTIARIDPQTGAVTGWLDLEPLLEDFSNIRQSIDVLNGIAYNQDTQQIFVTGKYWPRIFEIQILESNDTSPDE